MLYHSLYITNKSNNDSWLFSPGTVICYLYVTGIGKFVFDLIMKTFLPPERGKRKKKKDKRREEKKKEDMKDESGEKGENRIRERKGVCRGERKWERRGEERRGVGIIEGCCNSVTVQFLPFLSCTMLPMIPPCLSLFLSHDCLLFRPNVSVAYRCHSDFTSSALIFISFYAIISCKILSTVMLSCRERST